MIRAQEFANAIGETYTIVRNVYGRPGREPRKPGPLGEIDFARGSHRRFVTADAIAWRITRDLSALGLPWDDAAAVVKGAQVADWVAEHVVDGAHFLAVYSIGEELVAWRGTPVEIAEILEADGKRYGAVSDVRMVSLCQALRKAKSIATAAGYRFFDGEIIPIEDDETK